MSVTIKTIVLGPLETNCYVLRADDSQQCVVVDPGMMPGPLLKYLAGEKLLVERILLTHGHGDHIAGITELKQAFPAAIVCCPAADAIMLTDAQANMSAPFGFSIITSQPDELLSPGGSITIGPTQWQVLDTSGHTPGGVSFYSPDAAVAITGDALFAGSIGRTDIPNASESQLVSNIRENLLSLPDETRVLPGHGPESTIGRERRLNLFLNHGQPG